MTDPPAPFMDRALELARSVLGTTSPNPAVGCVIVRDGVIVAQGATEPPGGPHAEKVALARAGDAARGAIMYVTLEPCCHHGRTPPCTDPIIQAGIAEVHAAVLDPNPLVGGKGKDQLEQAGIRVILGERQREAAQLNEGFFKWITRKLPFVYAKFAASLDGKIATATGESRWITGEQSRARVHQLRATVDAIMVGARTAVRDDPQLTARAESGALAHQPLRVVVDSRAGLPPTARMLREPGNTLVAVTEAAPRELRRGLELAGAEVLVLPARDGRVDLEALMRHLAERGIARLLVEGGGDLLGALFDGGHVDKVLGFLSPAIIGGANAPAPVGGRGAQHMAQILRLRDVVIERLGDDLLISGYTGA